MAVSGSAVAVGARAAAASAGKAYVYEPGGAGWNEVARFTGEAAGDRFGVAAALSGGRLVIGAMLHGGTGAAYVYGKQGTQWAQRGAPLLGNAPGGRFGQAVAIDPEHVLVGAYAAVRGADAVSLCPLDQPPAADLRLTASGPSSVRPGETALYELTATNQGPDPATQVLLKAAIPAGLQWVGASFGAAQTVPPCTAAEDGIVCNLPDLAAGAPRVVSLKFIVLETCIPAATVQGTVSAAEHVPPVMSNPVSTAIRRTADLEISATAPTLINPGASIPFGLTVTNLGPDLACGVVVDAGPAAALAAAAPPPDCATTANHFPCAIGELAPQAPYALSASVTTSPEARCGTNFVYTARVSAFPASADPTSSNDSQASTATFVSGLAITKTGGLVRGFPGDGVSYTIRVDNPAGGSVRVVDVLPAGLGGLPGAGIMAPSPAHPSRWGISGTGSPAPRRPTGCRRASSRASRAGS